MPRVAGQIDLAKNEAILDAASEVLSLRGFTASMDEIARLAGVSKQTIYNHYGGKAELVRALAERRVHEVTAPLNAPEAAEHPEAALAA
ncbi:MAG TPA: helix-turn-helix domain-containing protein, partial [Phenylobacterium sp.]